MAMSATSFLANSITPLSSKENGEPEASAPGVMW
jgi:hypothetical protein